jgi:hypothetical protein
MRRETQSKLYSVGTRFFFWRPACARPVHAIRRPRGRVAVQHQSLEFPSDAIVPALTVTMAQIQLFRDLYRAKRRHVERNGTARSYLGGHRQFASAPRSAMASQGLVDRRRSRKISAARLPLVRCAQVTVAYPANLPRYAMASMMIAMGK